MMLKRPKAMEMDRIAEQLLWKCKQEIIKDVLKFIQIILLGNLNSIENSKSRLFINNPVIYNRVKYNLVINNHF